MGPQIQRKSASNPEFRNKPENFQPCSCLFLPFQEKKMHMKMSSAEVFCYKKLPNITDELSIEANSVDQEQTAPIGAV